ncbi:helix-turn-helix domain-containing protein [Halobacterium zhouii]|uniref:helix-turn-helix domain-containing protein n=1 Tax=Halobacterium zhouii TaxID=2902624 RepID=UPI001E3F632F|nr:helix-turn-helix domain-containing protein [Halobacterium zhouii]
MIEECLAVEFSVSGDDCPLAEATRTTGTSADAQPPQLREDGYALVHFSSANGDALADALDGDDRVRYLHVARSDGRYNYRCLSKHPCVVHELVSAGFLVDGLHYDAGDARYTGAVVGHDVLKGVLDTAGDTVGVTLERVFPLAGEDDAPVADRWGVTPAQADALLTAREMGYFEVPRGADATDVADELGVSKSAFLERLRRGQNRLLGEAL